MPRAWFGSGAIATITLLLTLAGTEAAAAETSPPDHRDRGHQPPANTDTSDAAFEERLRALLRRFDKAERDRSLSSDERSAEINRIREEGLKQFPFDTLSPRQLATLTSYVFFSRRGKGTDFTPHVVRRLRPLTEDPTEDGAYAASVLATVQPTTAENGPPINALHAIQHPSAPLLLRDDRGKHLFALSVHALRIPATGDDPPPGVAAVESLIYALPADFDATNLSGSDRLYEALARHEHSEARTLAETLREKLLDAGRARREFASARSQWWVDLRLAFLEHAPKRLNLLHNPAPDIPLEWWSDSGKPINRLSELRGNIIVLDFWASTCGFCHVAHECRDRLVRTMSGMPVTFIALADHEPEFILTLDPHESISTPTLDDSVAATQRYIELHELSMTFAIADWREYKAQYGVRGVPMTVIIDHLGLVRALDHDPRRPEATAALIQTLLSERDAHARGDG